MTERTFPVLWQGDRTYLRRLEELECPRSVPWDFIGEHEVNCLRNHDQTPERLAERGGLAPAEMLAVIAPEGTTFDERRRLWSLPPEEEVSRLKEALADWLKARS